MTDHLELEVRCRECRRLWIPLHGDYVRGTWRLCPRCRDPGPREQAAGGITRNQRIKRARGRTAVQER